jgi:hypothetical protein
LALSSAVFLVGNSIHVSNGTRPAAGWYVGGLVSGGFTAIAGLVQVGFGFLVRALSDGGGTHSRDLALFIAGGAEYILGSLTFALSLTSALLPTKPPATVVPTVIAAGDQPVPALALVAAW